MVVSYLGETIFCGGSLLLAKMPDWLELPSWASFFACMVVAFEAAAMNIFLYLYMCYYLLYSIAAFFRAWIEGIADVFY